MTNSARPQRELHSAAQFGKQRDFWWNQDFLELMARRWRLDQAESILDLGCGQGHWSRLLFRFTKRGARCVCVDIESEWLRLAQEYFRRDYPDVPSDNVVFLQGSAYDIPCGANEFDVATCQTLLMHLESPKSAVREMTRVVKAGGLIICSEPNNFFNDLGSGPFFSHMAVEALVRNYELWLRCHRGKVKLGFGDEWIGEVLPGILSEAGLVNIQVYISDKASPLYPPYNDEEQRTMIAQGREWKENQIGSWDFAEIEKFYLAGGGQADRFSVLRKDMEQLYDEQMDQMAKGRLSLAGGGLHYLISGRKRKA